MQKYLERILLNKLSISITVRNGEKKSTRIPTLPILNFFSQLYISYIANLWTLVPKQDTEHCNICSKAFTHVFQHAIASCSATSIVRCTFLFENLVEYENICEDFITLSEYEF
jgi:hypothetical protein